MRGALVKIVLASSISVVALSGYAGADPSPVDGAVSAGDAARARAAASAPDVTATVGRFLGRAAAPGSRSAAAPAVRATVGGTPVAVYELSPEFVAGRSTKAGKLAYLAVPARGEDGSTASVWTVRDQRGDWVVANIAAGDVEFRNAAGLAPGAVLLREPQTNTWYAVDGASVRPLAGGAAIPLAEYQRGVAARYGDKLPGSAYDRSGLAGGFSPAAQAVTPAPASAGAPWLVAGVLVVGVAVVAFAAAAPARRRG